LQFQNDLRIGTAVQFVCRRDGAAPFRGTRWRASDPAMGLHRTEPLYALRTAGSAVVRNCARRGPRQHPAEEGI